MVRVRHCASERHWIRRRSYVALLAKATSNATAPTTRGDSLAWTAAQSAISRTPRPSTVAAVAAPMSRPSVASDIQDELGAVHCLFAPTMMHCDSVGCVFSGVSRHGILHPPYSARIHTAIAWLSRLRSTAARPRVSPQLEFWLGSAPGCVSRALPPPALKDTTLPSRRSLILISPTTSITAFENQAS